VLSTACAVSARLAQHDRQAFARQQSHAAAETLDTYSHLWPDSDDRTGEAVDLVLAIPATDSVRTSEVAER
jgi:hypothetical protein